MWYSYLVFNKVFIKKSDSVDCFVFLFYIFGLCWRLNIFLIYVMNMVIGVVFKSEIGIGKFRELIIVIGFV